MYKIEFIIKNAASLDKNIIMDLMRSLRQMHIGLSRNEIKENIKNGKPIIIENYISNISDEFLYILQKSNVDIIIKYDDKIITINELIKQKEKELSDFDDDEDDL